MSLLRRPWFLIFLLAAGVYTYQFYNRVEVSTTQADAANPTETSKERSAIEQDRIAVKVSESYPAARVKNFKLSIDLPVSVHFVASDSDEVILSLVGEGRGYKNDGQQLSDWFRVKNDSTTLKVVSYEKRGQGGMDALKDLAKSMKGETNDSQLKLMVEYPDQHVFGALKFEVLASDVFAEGLQFRKLHMSTVSGNLRLEKAVGQKIEIESVSGEGNIEIDGLNKMAMSSVSADLILRSKSNPAVEFESVSGDMKLVIPSDSQVDVSFNSMTGDLINDFSNTPSATKKLKFSSLSGSATINKTK